MAKNLLFTVLDPLADEQWAIARAEQLAVDQDADLHLFCCNYKEDFSAFSSKHDAKHQTLEGTKDWLESVAQPLRDEGLQVTVEAYWNDDPSQSIIHAAARVGADMIVTMSLHDDKMHQRLLRQSPCSVLLVQSNSPWLNQRLLAAVGVYSNDAEHELLNNAIITEGQRLARATRSRLHLVGALDKAPPLTSVLQLLVESPEDKREEDTLAEHFGVAPECVHLSEGAAKTVIADAVESLQADALIIGTVARKGIHAALLGNTAEQLLKHVDADVLVVN